MIESQFVRLEPWKTRRESLTLCGDESWYVARSLPRQEARPKFQLLLRGFRSFLPRMAKTIWHARKSRRVYSAVFPSHMFVVLDPGRDRWRSLKRTFGVASLIMRVERPQPVPNDGRANT